MKSLSLSLRVTLLVGLAVLVLVGAAALAMDQMVDRTVAQRMDTALVTQAQTLVSLAETDSGGLDLSRINEPRPRLFTGTDLEYWEMHCRDGRVARSNPPPPVYPVRWRGSAQATPTFANVGKRSAHLRAVWFRFAVTPRNTSPATGTAAGRMPCSVVFIHSRVAVSDILSDIDDILLSIPLLALLAVLMATPVLVHRGLRPLIALGNAMRAIGPRAPGRRLPRAGTSELEPLVTRFNGVLDRMDEGVARERQFAGALAHETRTHLAELRSLVEVEERYPSQQPLPEFLSEISTIVGELQGTVSSLLLLTRLEAGIEGTTPTNVDLAQLLDRQLEGTAAVLRERNITVDRRFEAMDVTLHADRALLGMVLGNLVNNAAAYAPEGSVITIAHTAQAVTFTNPAPDVALSEVERLGQRFWSKHHGSSGHVGLGLPLASAAATAMGLELKFALDAQHNLHATLSWPSTKTVS